MAERGTRAYHWVICFAGRQANSEKCADRNVRGGNGQSEQTREHDEDRGR